MLEWTDKIDGIDDIMAEDVNKLAHSIIENKNTAETKEDASAKLQEAKDYTDDNCWREWQPNTEYTVGDKVIIYLPGAGLHFVKCKTAHTSEPDVSDDSPYWDYSENIVFKASIASIATVASNDDMGNNIIDTYAKKSDLSSYSQKPTIITDNTSTTYNLEFLGSTNKIIRLSTLNELNFTFHDGEYNADLLINVVFTSGDTPTQISYPNTGIINWIGTDCALSEGQSIFAPAANTRYDIVFSFDGSQLVGYVCGYTPATVSNG